MINKVVFLLEKTLKHVKIISLNLLHFIHVIFWIWNLKSRIITDRERAEVGIFEQIMYFHLLNVNIQILLRFIEQFLNSQNWLEILLRKNFAIHQPLLDLQQLLVLFIRSFLLALSQILLWLAHDNINIKCFVVIHNFLWKNELHLCLLKNLSNLTFIYNSYIYIYLNNILP